MKKLLYLSSLLAVGLLALSATPAKASNNAADNSSLYGGSWSDGSNNGFGFDAWTFNSNGNAGRYIGPSGLSGSSFALYSSDPGSSYDAIRGFTGGSLLSGQTFSLSLGYTGIGTGGVVGLDLQSNGNSLFSLQGDGTGDWQINDGGTFFDTGVAESGNTAFNFSFTYNGGESYTYTLGNVSNTFTATSDIGAISSVHFYTFQQGAGQNFGFDNLAIVPEPSTWVMVAGGLGMLALLRRRRAS